MREKISEWSKRLEALVAKERGGARFADVQRPNEYINMMGLDSSILEIVLNRPEAGYEINIYTRVVWSERNPPDTPFTFARYVYVPYSEDEDPQPHKPKQAFFDDKDFAERQEYAAAAIEKRLFPQVSPAAP